VVVGGGASGLAAAALLTQRNIDTTLIEVKRQVGGSLSSVTRESFIFDGARSVFDRDLLEHPLIQEWGLKDALVEAEGGVIFRHGAQSFVEALSAHITGPRLMRMALSSIGELEGGSMALCMENGLVLNARAIILALPARYAERVFYGYRSEITEHLMNYEYDERTHLSLGYREALDNFFIPAEAYTVQMFYTPERMPAGGEMIRFPLPKDLMDEVGSDPKEISEEFDLPLPDAVHLAHWPEADADTLFTPDYEEWRETLMGMLPPRVALIGSDYVPYPTAPHIMALDQCLTQAQDAVEKILREM
jgi:protoporphyrinogen oxidase